MNRPRSPARIVVRSRDLRLRAEIEERLADLGDVTVEDGTGDTIVDVQVNDAGTTAREREVLSLLAEGLANKQVADRLDITAHTAKFHVESLLRKLGAANRAEAVKEGIRRGLIGI